MSSSPEPARNRVVTVKVIIYRHGMSSRRSQTRAGRGPDRQMRRVVLARLISTTGAEAAFLLGLWGKAAFIFGGSPVDLALMSALVGMAGILGSVLGGVFVDRWDARRVVIAAEVLFVPATLALVF